MDDHFDIGRVFEIGKFDITRLTCILNGERLSCPASNLVHLMTSDVNKWCDVTQNLRLSSVLLTFFYVKCVEIVINRL